MRSLVRNQWDVLLGKRRDFIFFLLDELRSLTAAQRRALAALQSNYKAAWRPVLQSLHRSVQLAAEPKTARLLIFSALHWSVQRFDSRSSTSIDDLSDAPLALLLKRWGAYEMSINTSN